MIQFFPYSPRWLAMVDAYDECLESLCKLRKLPASDSRVQAEFKGILTEVKFQNVMSERRHPGLRGLKLEVAQWLDLFAIKRWRRTAAGAGVAFFQQFQGVNVSYDKPVAKPKRKYCADFAVARPSSIMLRLSSPALVSRKRCLSFCPVYSTHCRSSV